MRRDTEGLAVMVCGHGSRDGDAIREFELVAAGIKTRLPHYDVETGYLEFARPMIRDGLEALKSRGARRILAVPGMLFAATSWRGSATSTTTTGSSSPAARASPSMPPATYEPGSRYSGKARNGYSGWRGKSSAARAFPSSSSSVPTRHPT